MLREALHSCRRDAQEDNSNQHKDEELSNVRIPGLPMDLLLSLDMVDSKMALNLVAQRWA